MARGSSKAQSEIMSPRALASIMGMTEDEARRELRDAGLLGAGYRTPKPSPEIKKQRQQEELAKAGDLKQKTLDELARLAERSWSRDGKVAGPAKPYLDALGSLSDMNSTYGADSARDIIVYFLGNATGWKGETAKAVKAELNRRLKER